MRAQSDAGILAQATWIPAWVWASLWTGASVAVLGGAAWLALSGAPRLPAALYRGAIR